MQPPDSPPPGAPGQFAPSGLQNTDLSSCRLGRPSDPPQSPLLLGASTPKGVPLRRPETDATPGPLRATPGTPQEGQRQTPPQALRATRAPPPEGPETDATPGAPRRPKTLGLADSVRGLAGLWDGRGGSQKSLPWAGLSGEVFLELSGSSPCLCLVHWAPVHPPRSVLPLPTGIIGNAYLNDSPLKKFRIYSLRWTELPAEVCPASVPAEGRRGCLGLRPRPALRGPWDPLPAIAGGHRAGVGSGHRRPAKGPSLSVCPQVHCRQVETSDGRARVSHSSWEPCLSRLPLRHLVKLEVAPARCVVHRGAHRLSVVASLVDSTGQLRGQDWGSGLSCASGGGSCGLGAVLAGLSAAKSPCHLGPSRLDTLPSVSRRAGKKGVVFINNQNLGRYWNIGPQETLYLPGVWLDVGLNKVVAHPRDLSPSPRPPCPAVFSGGAWVGGERTNVSTRRQAGRLPRSSP